ncbi:MAG: hypothetical protein H6626_14530 [Pseudobdellovibrionaceae bacterium]|nr:hypothetical protein [Bdellovibrionales bacterium]USN47383.1 MAG: hypothetical protein H6626_14530 [Pseudobdellovibrionaceae bacterium]
MVFQLFRRATRATLFIVTLIELSAHADHVPVEKPHLPPTPIYSRSEVTPLESREVLSTVDGNANLLSSVETLVGNLLWSSQDNITDSIFDRLSRISVSGNFFSQDLFTTEDNQQASLNLAWELASRRRIFLDGPATATSPKPFGYYEVNGLMARLRLGVVVPYSDVGAHVALGAGASFHYVRQTDLHKLQELRHLSDVSSRYSIHPEVAESLDPVFSVEDQTNMFVEESVLKDAQIEMDSKWDQIVGFFEKGAQSVANNFVDSDSGKANVARLFDPLRLPARFMDINGDLAPISWKKVLQMKDDEMLFFTTYFDGGTGIHAGAGTIKAGISTTGRVAYHTSVKKLSDSIVRLKTQIAYSRSYEWLRVRGEVGVSLGFARLNYEYFRLIQADGQTKAVEFVYDYDLSHPDAQKAFNALLKMQVGPTFRAIQNKSGWVASVIGRRETLTQLRSGQFNLNLPFALDYSKNSLSAVKQEKTFTSDQDELISNVLTGQSQFSRSFKYNLGNGEKDDENRIINSVVVTHLDDRNDLMGESAIEPKQDKGVINSEVSLSYLWEDNYTSPREFKVMGQFLKYLFADRPEITQHPDFKKFMSQKFEEDASQSFFVNFQYSQEAITRILAQSTDQVWNEIGDEIFFPGVWRDKRTRSHWVRDNLLSNPDGAATCDAVGLLQEYGYFVDCFAFYDFTQRLADAFKDIKHGKNYFARTRQFTKMAEAAGHNPVLAFLMLKLNGGFDGVNYNIYLNGNALDHVIELSGGQKWKSFDLGYQEPIANVNDMISSPKTIRHSEVFEVKETGALVLGIETSRRIPEDHSLHVDLYDFEIGIRDRFINRYKVAGRLVPIPYGSHRHDDGEDMKFTRYRYEITLPPDLKDEFRKGLRTMQFLFTSDDLSAAASEVSELLVHPVKARTLP